jgi:uncharacterized protein (DUF2141 family)
MRDMIRVFSVLAVCLLSLARCLAQEASPQGASSMSRWWVGLRNNKGQVFCALYASAEGFPKDGQKAIRRNTSSISDQKASCEFSLIEAGTHAVSVFHDENSNGKLDTNFLGTPREGIGPPTTPEATWIHPNSMLPHFQFFGGRLNLKITINYL